MRTALITGLVVFLGGCGDPERDPTQWPIALADLVRHEVPVDAGEAAYRRTCIACHMSDGKGNGGTTAADLTRADGLLSHPDAEVLAVIRDGRTGAIGVMPPHAAILTPAELEGVVAYLRRTIAPNVSITAPADAGTASATDGALPPL